MRGFEVSDWQQRLAAVPMTSIMGTLKRMVESQAQTVTLPLVDNLAEHDLLEDLLEASKPPLPPKLARFDYLLRSPWRYPPLHWGSRFGRAHEPSLFYGALSAAALFAETAFYRLVFLDGPKAPFAERVISQHTLFEARFKTHSGHNLAAPPLAEHHAVLTDPADYGPCQNLGAALRGSACEAFIYRSARVAPLTQDGNNIALLSPDALHSRKHQNPQPVLCESTVERVLLRYRNDVFQFEREQFTVQGRLPKPA